MKLSCFSWRVDRIHSVCWEAVIQRTKWHAYPAIASESLRRMELLVHYSKELSWKKVWKKLSSHWIKTYCTVISLKLLKKSVCKKIYFFQGKLKPPIFRPLCSWWKERHAIMSPVAVDLIWHPRDPYFFSFSFSHQHTYLECKIAVQYFPVFRNIWAYPLGKMQVVG